MTDHDTSPPVARVSSLYRYPVKSLGGETLLHARIDRRGLAGDRLWAVRDEDGKLGSGKSSRRFRRMDGLLALEARYDGETPVLAFPDGRCCRGDDAAVHAALTGYVGRPVTLAREDEESHFDDGPVHLVTTSTLRRLQEAHGGPVDARRFRPNLVLETGAVGYVEDGWVGRRITVGSEVVLAVRAPMPRCVMVTLAQGPLPADDGLLRSVTRAHEGDAGVWADVVAVGRVSVGDPVRLLG